MATRMAKVDGLLEPLDVSNVSSIDSWLDRFKIYCNTNDKVVEDNKTAFYLTLIGKGAYDLLSDLAYPKKPADMKVDDLHGLLVKHLRPKNFQGYERVKFNQLVRMESESVASFVRKVQHQASSCGYGAQLEDQIRDRLIAGVNNVKLQRKMLQLEPFEMKNVKDLLEQYGNKEEDSKCALYQKKHGNSKFSQYCFSCSDNHNRAVFRYRSFKCHICKKVGHLAKVCKQKEVNMIG